MIERLLQSSNRNRFIFFLCSDLVIITTTFYLAFLLRFDLIVVGDQYELFLELLPFVIAFKLAAFFAFRVYRIAWRYVGLNEMYTIGKALIFAELAIVAFAVTCPWISDNLAAPPLLYTLPKGFVVDFFASFILIGGLRASKRLYLEIINNAGMNGKQGARTIILGAGNTGEMILRDITKQKTCQFCPVGFLDDDKLKAATYVHGVPVLGTCDQLGGVVKENQVEAVIVAIPSLDYKSLRRIYETAKKANISTIKIVPSIYEFNKPDINLKALEDISVEDLIGRQSFAVDFQAIEGFLRGKNVLITGAGGSIGSEIVLQTCAFGPESLVLFDIDETELHNLSLRLSRLFPLLNGQVKYVTGDIRDQVRINQVFQDYRPDIVFHAAAYKHVPMMEYNPREAVKVNIFGTYNLAKASRDHGVEKFIMISTDKAVRPTSVMGATKRVAEYICGAFNEDRVSGVGCRVPGLERKNGIKEKAHNNGKNGSRDLNLSNLQPATCNLQPVLSTRFTSVRFGNVLASRGSVLPLFLDQLKHGGPLTVTHKDMKRYFMTIPEAVSLVLQAAVIGKGGDVLVLDMGEPIRIVEIAEELIKLHGLKPYKDVEITFTGLRPGEKLFEEILTAEEGTDATKHQRIFIARNGGHYLPEEIRVMLADFSELLNHPTKDSDGRTREKLKKWVKQYSPSGSNDFLARSEWDEKLTQVRDAEGAERETAIGEGI